MKEFNIVSHCIYCKLGAHSVIWRSVTNGAGDYHFEMLLFDATVVVIPSRYLHIREDWRMKYLVETFGKNEWLF